MEENTITYTILDEFKRLTPEFVQEEFLKSLNQKPIFSKKNTVDFIFHSVVGNSHEKYNCKKIMFCGENFKISSYGNILTLSFDDDSDLNICYPLFLLYDSFKNIIKDEWVIPKEDIVLKRGFCSMVVSNPGPIIRKNFFKVLHNLKHVTSAGAVLNNISVKNLEDFPKNTFKKKNDSFYLNDKFNFVKSFKFNLCFENCRGNSYVTEKILQAFHANTIPIYWGSEKVHDYFNSKCFIDASKFNTYKGLAEYVCYVDNNKNEYLKYFEEDPFIKIRTMYPSMKENMHFKIQKYLDDPHTLKQYNSIFHKYKCLLNRRMYELKNNLLERIINLKLKSKI